MRWLLSPLSIRAGDGEVDPTAASNFLSSSCCALFQTCGIVNHAKKKKETAATSSCDGRHRTLSAINLVRRHHHQKVATLAGIEPTISSLQQKPEGVLQKKKKKKKKKKYKKYIYISHLWTPPADVLGDNNEYDQRGLPQRQAIAAWHRVVIDRFRSTPLAAAVAAGRVNVPPRIGTSAPLEAIIPKPVARFAMEQRLPNPVLPRQANQYTLLNMARPYTIRRIRRVLNARAFTNTLGRNQAPQPDDLRGFWKGVNSKALTAREREVWFKLIRGFTPTRKLQFNQKHDTSPACLVCGAPEDDIDHYFFGCYDSKNVWTAARGVLSDALGRDTIDDAHYTTLQRFFGLPKLKASLSDQEGAGRTIEIFTGMVLETISSGRWRMQRHGARLESVERRRVVLEERMKLRAGGARGRRGQ
ncbi:BQ2448_3285 [Microbotryum intermedium]|uniref:BQ2448_3285 protein n=1 Tax=Microbotryum intermedium TaxID=269621 RepID=A0A238FER2_9BASI|nr:BQ2448_3285 [Microbotryum intermedium]